MIDVMQSFALGCAVGGASMLLAARMLKQPETDPVQKPERFRLYVSNPELREIAKEAGPAAKHKVAPGSLPGIKRAGGMKGQARPGIPVEKMNPHDRVVIHVHSCDCGAPANCQRPDGKHICLLCWKHSRGGSAKLTNA